MHVPTSSEASELAQAEDECPKPSKAATGFYKRSTFDAILAITLRIAERELELLGAEVDAVRCGDDLGGQTGLQISYDHYARFIKPRPAKFFRRVRELTQAKLMFHSCRSIVDILVDLVDIGVDIINPVQATVAAWTRRFSKRNTQENWFSGAAPIHKRPCPSGLSKTSGKWSKV
jgi:hypothetical protein